MRTKKKEDEFFKQLEETLKPLNLNVVKQYVVLKKYRVDCYIPDINMVIEYDEDNHWRYCENAEKVREQAIEKELGCKFIRISDLDDHYVNLRIVIREILNYLHSNRDEKVFNNEFILKRKRYEKGISSKDIAKDLDVSPVTLKKYENGNCGSMTLKTLKKLVNVLDLTEEEIVELVYKTDV